MAAEHERNYLPSEWSKRFNSVDLLLYFNRQATEITKHARNTVKWTGDIPYDTSSERTKYDIYGTDLPNDAPVCVFIHGGYWQEFHKDFSGFLVKLFVSKGIKVVIVGYDLCPQVRLGDICNEIKAATTKILKEFFELGSRCVWIVGHSAGAHLTLSLLYDKAWLESIDKYLNVLKGMLLISGVYELRPLLTTSMNDALKLTEEELLKYSFTKPPSWKHPFYQQLKVIVAVSEDDSPIFIKESQNCAKTLTEYASHVEYICLSDNIDHFEIVEKFGSDKYKLSQVLLQSIVNSN